MLLHYSSNLFYFASIDISLLMSFITQGGYATVAVAYLYTQNSGRKTTWIGQVCNKPNPNP